MIDVTTNCHRKTARTCVIVLLRSPFPLLKIATARLQGPTLLCYIRSPFARHKIAAARPMLLLTPESFSATLSTSVLRIQYHDGNFHHFILTSPFNSLLGYCFHCDWHFLLACLISIASRLRWARRWPNSLVRTLWARHLKPPRG
jgi:hypothetical protein